MSQHSDTARLDALTYPWRTNVFKSQVKFEDDTHWSEGWTVAGGGVQAGAYRTLREALDGWIDTLDAAIEYDPEHFGDWQKFREANG